jgi:hypothetical protein
MFILFGRRTTRKALGRAQQACPRCRQHAWQNYWQSSSWFTLFFIPCIPLGTSTVAQCVTCGNVQRVDQTSALATIGQQRQLAAPPR